MAVKLKAFGFLEKMHLHDASHQLDQMADHKVQYESLDSAVLARSDRESVTVHWFEVNAQRAQTMGKKPTVLPNV